MPQITIGGVTVTMPDTIRIPERAGKLSTKDQQRIPKAHKEVGKTAQATATAMRNSPERFMVPGVTPDGLADIGRQADEIDSHITSLEAVLVTLRQANLLLDSEAHNQLRRVNAFVNSQEKFDPTLPALVPQLKDYFGKEASAAEEEEEEPESP